MTQVYYRAEQEIQPPMPEPHGAGFDDAAEAVRRASPGERSWSGAHPVNVRLSIPLFVNRYYLTIVVGRERRSLERLGAERRKHPLKTVGNAIFALIVGTVIGLAVLTMFQLAIVAVLRDTI